MVNIDFNNSSLNEFQSNNMIQRIIINDDDCSDNFFDSVCSYLSDSGINISISKKGDDINYNNAIVITLDQQYYSGEGAVLFAPSSNYREGNSDSLVLAMGAALYSKKIPVSGILGGKRGFFNDEKGNLISTIPTNTETKIDTNYETSFVTVSFGTGHYSTDLVGEIILDCLSRFKSYLDSSSLGNDLLYFTSGNESIQDVAKYFDTSEVELKNYNNLSDSSNIPQGTIIINPVVKTINDFSVDVMEENIGRKR